MLGRSFALTRIFHAPDALIGTALDSGANRIDVNSDPMATVKDADVVYTDVGASMGQEREHSRRAQGFAPSQVNAALLCHAAADVILAESAAGFRGGS